MPKVTQLGGVCPQALLRSPMVICHCALPGRRRRNDLEVKGGCVQGLQSTRMAVVDTQCMCVRAGGCWWKMNVGGWQGPIREALWVQLRSLPLTQMPRSHEKVQ